jgi:type I restriction enzyme, S subunit
MSWPLVRLDSIQAKLKYAFVGGPFGSNLTSKHYTEAGVPVIRGQNLGGSGLFEENGFVFVSEEKADQLRSNNAFRGDLLFTQRGTLGQVGLIPQESKYARYVVSQSQMKLTVDSERVDARYVYQFFRLPSTIQRILNLTITAGVPHINLGILKSFEIPLPPLEQQVSIGNFAQNYDDLIATNQRRIQLLEDAARRLYREWFVHLRYPGHELVTVKVGVPQGWTNLTMNDVCDAIGGGTPSTERSEYWDGDVVWVTPTDVTRNDCLVMLDSTKKITEVGLANSSAKLVPAETILMTSRASIGFFALMDQPVCTNQGFISVIPKQDNTRMYLLFNMMGRVEEMITLATGSTFKELSKKTFRSLPINWPTPDILQAFEDTVYPMIQQTRHIKKQSEQLKRARDLLLPKLMSGQLDVSGITLHDEVVA